MFSDEQNQFLISYLDYVAKKPVTADLRRFLSRISERLHFGVEDLLDDQFDFIHKALKAAEKDLKPEANKERVAILRETLTVMEGVKDGVPDTDTRSTG